MSVHELFLPVHDFVVLRAEEREVVNHAAFQRLGRVYQLGQTHLVYRGATHTRLEHALGTLCVADKMITAIRENHARHAQEHQAWSQRHGSEPDVADWELAPPLSEHEAAFVRLGALLHDIGHIPCGHTLEDEMGLIRRVHDSWERVSEILNRPDWGEGAQGRSLREVIDTNYGRYLAPSPAFRPSDLLCMIICKNTERAPQRQGRFCDEGEFRLQVYRDMIGDTICADLLDYIHRDWHHIGKVRRFDQRILQYMELRRRRGGSDVRFVISLGQRPRLKTDAISTILELLEARYQLHEYVVFHRVKLAASAMLERAIQESAVAGGRTEELEERLLRSSDEGAIEYLMGQQSPGETTQRLLRSLKQRQLHVMAYVYPRDGLPPEQVVGLNQLYGELGRGAANRLRTARLLESDFGLQPGSIAIYCPPQKLMRAKLPEVNIYVGGQVDKFGDWEKNNDNALAGGAIDAQNRRFQRLWRILFFVERQVHEALERDGRLQDLKDAIEQLALGQIPPWTTKREASQRLAQRLRRPPPPAAGLVGPPAQETYPTGAPSLRSWSREEPPRSV